jgi:glyoxalase family protein
LRFEGIHHVSAITGDVRRNFDFYARVLGLRLVKKSVSQDVPSIYQLYYGAEHGGPGATLAFYEYPGIQVGRAGVGMIHRLGWRIGSEKALGFWARRLRGEGVEYERSGARLRFRDPEGLALELTVTGSEDAPLAASHPDIPEELALQGFDSVRVYARSLERSRELLERTLAFQRRGEAAWEVRGKQRGCLFAYDSAPVELGIQGSGTVHHVAWACPAEESERWHDALVAAGVRTTPIIDRFWYRSVYFREPSGALFEIATIEPGFGVDGAVEQRDDRLVLPPAFEHLRGELEASLTPFGPRRVRGETANQG